MKVLSLVLALVSFSTVSLGLTLKEKKEMKAAEGILAESLKSTKETCGAKGMSVKVDWKSFTGQYKDSYAMASAAHYCTSVLDGIRYICEDADAKSTVAEKVKSVTCAFQKDATKFKAELKGSGVNAFYNWDTPNIADETKAWLMNTI